MKKILAVSLAFFAVLNVFSQTSLTPTVKDVNTQLDIKNAAYDFGKISFGKPVEYVVEMKNIGKDTLTILSAQPGCGCTTPSFVPNEKFGPNQSVKMTIRFNGSAVGTFTRYVDVNFSGGLTKKLTFNGEGIQEAAPASPAAATTTPITTQKSQNK